MTGVPLAALSAPMRVARALSVLGVCSRRDGDRLIAEGRVAVAGRPVTSPNAVIDLATDTLSVDGRRIEARPVSQYVALNKPRGVVCTARDRHAGVTVVDLVRSDARLYPVCRLDKDSEGLILLTNDGDFAQTVAHPRFRTEKEYLLLVRQPVSETQLRRLRTGVELDGRPARPVAVGVYRGPLSAGRPADGRGGTWLRIVLHEGRNREVRRMLESVGLRAARLVRTRIGAVRLGRLPPGQWRGLTDSEVRALSGGGAGRHGQEEEGRQPSTGERDARKEVPRVGTFPAPFVVAIDGPSAAGKTAVGTRLAKRFGCTFLDTGVLYRAVALRALERGISAADAAGLARLARGVEVIVREPEDESGEVWRVWLGGRDVTEAIRSADVDARVSQVAAHPEVRSALIPAQRSAAGPGCAIVAGRDIGTVIFPDAAVKIYLDASPEERARRRARQLGRRAGAVDVREAIDRRDEADRSRSVAPLDAGPDAEVIHTDGLDLDEVVDRVWALVERRRAGDE